MKELVLEFVFEGVSPKLLWKQISTPQGLSTWYADGVSCDGNQCVFRWNKTTQDVKILAQKENQYFSFAILDEDGTEQVVRFTVLTSDITKDTTLRVTEMVNEEEEEEFVDMWNNQVEKLKRTLGV